MAEVYFTSDLHLGHSNMLKFRSDTHGTTFSTVEEMNNHIVEKWNSRVKKRDLVWVLGDVAMQDMSSLEYLKQCNGTKKLVMGNHDTCKSSKYLQYFSSLHGCVRKYGWTLTHVPIHPQEMEYRNWKVNIHGHVHHKGKLLGHPYYCVNVDVRNYLPVSLGELREEVKKGDR